MVKDFVGVPVLAQMVSVVMVAALSLGAGPARSAEDRPAGKQHLDKRVVIAQGAESYGPVTPYTTVPLTALPQRRAWSPGDPIREIPRRIYPAPNAMTQSHGTGVADNLPALNDDLRAPTLQVDVNIAGIAFTGAVPPDTVGDVGPNHFVQAVNASRVAVYAKDGTLLAGPFTLDTLAPGGDQCSNGGGDPIVLYDQLADRWFLQEFISGGNRLCIYISKTADPTGEYYFYGFPTPSFPDYPHYGVWTDAYLAGTNESNPETTYAFDRVKMLAGLPATVQRLANVPPMSGYGFQVLTPADHDGATPPPAGAPGIFMRHFDDEAHGPANPASDSLQMFEMDIDWTTPANTSVVQLPSVSITDYNSWFLNYTTFHSIPQPGSSTKLDPIREAILNRLVYRNFGTHEALVGNFATNRNPATSGTAISAGIRWFELRRSGGPGNPWVLHQEGTFGGDSDSPTAQYFMGGIAMDGAGNIGLGYSKTDISGSTPVQPSIGVSGHLANDVAGSMGPEHIVAVGAVASNQGGGRWGDYAAMGMDPTDDCTFWYTNEYMPGSNWGTRITSFVFEECLFGFTMDVQPPEAGTCALSDPEPQFTIEIDETGGWGDMVSLAASGLPPGTSASFSSNGQTPPFTSVLTIQGTAASVSGSYAIDIAGTGSDAPPTERSAQVLLHLAVAMPDTPVLLSPGNGAPGMPLAPTLAWNPAAEAGAYLVEVATDAGFTNIAYSAVETGTSHKITAALAPTTQYFWRVTADNECGTETSAARSFTTVAIVCEVLASTDVPVTIPPSAGTIGSDLVVSADGAVADVDVVDLAGNHSYVSDLTFSLVSPLGTEVTLLGGACGNNDNFDLNFDDEAAPGAVPCPPTSGGTYRPSSPLSAIDGEEAAGTWVLEVTDGFNQDGGSLASWGMQLCVEADPAIVPAFTSTPVTSVARGEAYGYAISAEAPGGNAAIVIAAETPLPPWLSLVDHGSGSATLSGTPGFDDLGAHAISLRAENGPAVAMQSFTITVLDVNEAPSFSSAAVTTGTRAQPYAYAVSATDPNPDAVLAFSAEEVLPGWLVLTDHGDGTAALAGTPGFADVGAQGVTLLVTDGEFEATQSFTITVADVNVAPSFVSTPVTAADGGAPYQYDVVASDPNLQAELSISSIAPLPAWLTLVDHGNGTATLAGTPGYQDAGEVYLVLQVSDGVASSEQPFSITVTATNEPPAFVSVPPARVVAGQSYSYLIEVDDPSGPIAISVEAALPAWLVFEDHGDGTALLSGTPAEPDIGMVAITLIASDGSLQVEQSFEIDVVGEPLFADGFEAQ